MSTIETTERLNQIAIAHGVTEIGCDEETNGGWSGRIERERLEAARVALRAANASVSDSRDEDGSTWIWWVAE